MEIKHQLDLERWDGKARQTQAFACEVALSIDTLALARLLGARALNSKARSATLAGGKIVAKIARINPVRP